MLDFVVNTESCTRCGECLRDCPARIISMQDGIPAIQPDKEGLCYKCQHCLAICPTGAISILGIKPSLSTPLSINFFEPAKMELLIKGRRSIRRFTEQNLDSETVQHLFDVACNAPSGMNMRQVNFTLIDGKEQVDRIRNEVMDGLAELVLKDALPAGMEFYKHFVKAWQEKKIDIIFRNAPYLVIATAPKSAVSGETDCIIALSYFELYAQSMGIGTLWNGLAKWALFDLVPVMRKTLGIPDDHIIGYAMTFGTPAVHFARTVQHGSATLHRIK